MWTRREFDAAQWSPSAEAEWFAALPAAPAVFALCARAAGGEAYVSKTANLRRRLQRLLGVAQGRRLSLRERVCAVEWQPVGGDFEAGFALYLRLRAEFPASYASRLHLRPAPLLQLLRENAYPRLAVTGRIRALRAGSEYFGPFASRAEAEQYAGDSLDFFLLRRCTEELSPDPAFPGCVYSEMKMCLAPCFGGCTDERYAQESARVSDFLESGGRSLAVQIARSRDEASQRMEYEAAAAAHARLEKVKALQSRLPAIVHRIDRLDGVLLAPSHLAGHIAIFRIAGGMLAGPEAFDVSARAAQKEGAAARSMEARIRETLAAIAAPAPANVQEWSEHLAILKRWYYRSHKVGEVFFRDRDGSLPMRRLVRAVGRVLMGEKPDEDSNSSLSSQGMA